MAPDSIDRLFSVRSAVHDPPVIAMTAAVAGLLAVAPVVFKLIDRARPMSVSLRRDLWDRYRSWLVLAPMMMLPVLLGAAATIVAVAALSLLCYREFARATGLFRDGSVSAVVVSGIVLIGFASLDHWYALFVSMAPIGVASIIMVAVLADRPSGFIQRVGLGVLGFAVCGVCLGHLGYLANDTHYRRILFWLVICVQLNDVFAYCCGKTFGRRKLAPRTSPNKTVGGAVGSAALTTALAWGLGRYAFAGTTVDDAAHLIPLGLIVGVLGSFGDLLLSSIKRDLGVKDMAATFPGHGGFLDRFASLLLAAPAVFHFVGYFTGIGLDQPARLFTGGK